MQVRTNISTNARYHRDAWLEINLTALEHNITTIYKEVNKPLIPVLKADAYGHGASVLASVLDGYDFIEIYAVASLDEAISLRQSTSKRIMVLGISPGWAYENALKEGIELTITTLEQARALDSCARKLNKTTPIHLKLDIGMHRIGFNLNEAAEFDQIFQEFTKLSNLNIKSVFSHFSTASDKQITEKEAALFQTLTENLDKSVARHLASYRATKLINCQNFDYVRIGIEMYGLGEPKFTHFKPLMSLYARVVQTRRLAAGARVSYLGTWQAQHDTTIATLPLGYADGVRRELSNKLSVFIPQANNYFKQIGLITMDQLMIDLAEADSEIQAGTVIELIGRNLPLVKWTRLCSSITYELACNLSLRLPRIYTRDF